MKKFGLILLTLLCLLLSSAALAEWDEERIFEYRVLENGTAEIFLKKDLPCCLIHKG